MEFSKPSIFYYLLLLAIPVIIHLFNFRKHKKIYFSSIKFLKEVEQKTKSKYEIKRWLILLARIMLITSVIFAFAIPYLQKKTNQKKAEKIGFYIDNSFSMERMDDNNTMLIDYAKNNAKNILKKLETNQKVLILTNDFNKKYQKWYSPKQAIDIINEIPISGSTHKIQTIVNRYNQVIDSTETNSLYIFSDFQKIKSNNEQLIINNHFNTKIGWLKSKNGNNISIDTCYFETPIRNRDTIEKLISQFTNHSENNQVFKVSLLINGQQKSLHSIEIPANKTITEEFHYSNPIKTSIVEGQLKIEDSSIEFDNQLYFSYSTEEQIHISTIYDDTTSHYLNNIFSDSLFKSKQYNIDFINYEELIHSQLIILDQLSELSRALIQKLEKYIKKGGNLFIFLNPNANLDSYNSLFQLINTDFISKWIKNENKLEVINYSNDLFKNVFKRKHNSINLPVVNNYFNIKENKNAQKREVLKFINNDPFLAEYLYGKGHIFLLFSDLNQEHNNFAEHALFVPCIYNSVIMHLKNRNIYHVIKNETIIEQNNIVKSDIIHLKKDISFDMIPITIFSDQRTLINFENKIKQDGSYELSINNQKQLITFNYDRHESKMIFLHKNQIKKMFQNNDIDFLTLESNHISKKYEENKKNNSLEHIFIIIAILLLIIELLLLKIWKI